MLVNNLLKNVFTLATKGEKGDVEEVFYHDLEELHRVCPNFEIPSQGAENESSFYFINKKDAKFIMKNLEIHTIVKELEAMKRICLRSP